MTHPNSFGSRATLEAGGRSYTIYRLDSLDTTSGGKAAPPSLQPQDSPRESPSKRRRKIRQEGRHRGARELGRERQGRKGDRVPHGARSPPGFHRRSRSRRPRRNARRARASSAAIATEDQSASAGRSRHRPLSPGGRVRIRSGVPHQRRTSSSSATRSATHFSAGARRRCRISASFPRTPESSTRSTSSISRRQCS